MNNLQLIWADSEVAKVILGHGWLSLRFAAAHVRRLDASGGDAWGYLPGLVLQCEGVDVNMNATTPMLAPMPEDPPEALPDALGRLSEGRWLVEGQPWPAWELGTALQGVLRLQLRFTNGTELDIAATQARASCPPGAAFRPSLAC
jgi:hypothetical protein